jgi:hypothetical protein
LVLAGMGNGGPARVALIAGVLEHAEPVMS